MKTIYRIIIFTIVFFISTNCSFYNKSISGYYNSSMCILIDYIYIKDDSTYSIKSQGLINEGVWEIRGDTIILMDNWKKSNLKKKNELLLNKNDISIFGEKYVNLQNEMFIEVNQPIRFIIRKNKFIGVDTAKYNYNKDCIFKKVSK
ncbi:hypothetical protein TRIP_D310001 [uncultured Paludibacter sp.]|uniref:Uncharacterized protein n=1 Tax=uncultured Paludibacter sp. TaxID=497635 RepID=A0A653AC67_9BACT|nr:hypothetical protein TRIP_D310001 [uncultured Paludibacter sp.]